MSHIPVLLNECIEGLNINPNGIYVDGTLGRAGHSLEILKKLDEGKLIAIDRDADAIVEVQKIFADYEEKVIAVHGDFREIEKILKDHNVEKVDGMLFDLGVSSPQIDNAERGFSYMQDAPLDMRMNRIDSLSAFDIINSWQEDELSKILFEYGEERFSRSIARVIVNERTKNKINTTFELNELIYKAIPAAARRKSSHPSKRCYQALRIAVNDELNSIVSMLVAAPSLLRLHGRLCVISFHSLEDRLVKKAFAAGAKGCTCPPDIPICVCGEKPTLKLITRKPIIASNDEMTNNPRSKSAKLRIAERI
ncbi:MAG: 16S rRNA (cytosine(1402)-N(4))-methyltransferase RsmH [Oscillospiraceae bacterium]|nr:16S rRNA (cytosine(1402)-N(4))-methyltransferase RsmH [Oscillospiraceae bacterium]